MDVKLRQLRYFKAVVEHGTIAAAAEALHIAQPPLSRCIRELEADWGVALFERVNRRLQLREEGRFLYARACELLELAGDIDAQMQQLAGGEAGRVRVGTTANGIEAVAAAVERLGRQRPALRFVCWHGEPLGLQRMVDERRLDVAVVPRPLETPGLSAQPLAKLHYVALAPPDSGLDAEVGLAELAERPLLLLHRASRSGSFERLIDAFQARALAPRIVAECSDATVLHALARRGVGVGMLAVSDGASVPVPGLRRHRVRDVVDDHAQLLLVRKQDSAPSAAVRDFCAQLVRALDAADG